MKNDTKTIGLLLIILSITIITLGIILLLQEPKKDNTKYETQTPPEEIIQEEDRGESVYNLLKEYSGIYTNENMEIQLFSPTDYFISFSLITDNSYIGGSLEINEDGNLFYEEDFDEEASIKIIKTETGIEVEATSTTKESTYNLASGTYTKKEFTSKNWNGVYQNGEIEINIDEYGPNNIYILITKGYSVYGTIVADYDEELIFEEDTSFSETETLKITKIDNGIKVESSSTDEESLLNEATGEYTRKY